MVARGPDEGLEPEKDGEAPILSCRRIDDLNPFVLDHGYSDDDLIRHIENDLP